MFKDQYAAQLTGVHLNEQMHPVQLYEAILNFLNFGILFPILRKKKFDGQVFAFYILNYSVIRFFTEYFRGDHGDNIYFIRGDSALSSLSFPQLACVLGLSGGSVLFVVLKRRGRAKT